MISDKTIQEVRKEIAKKEEKRAELMRKGKVVQAVAIDGELKRLLEKVQYMIDNERTELKTLIKDDGEDVVYKWESTCLYLVVVLDMADMMAKTLNDMMDKKCEGMCLSAFKEVHSISQQLNRIIKVLDYNSNMETKEDWGNLSDDIQRIVWNAVHAHMAKIKNEKKVSYTK